MISLSEMHVLKNAVYGIAALVEVSLKKAETDKLISVHIELGSVYLVAAARILMDPVSYQGLIDASCSKSCPKHAEPAGKILVHIVPALRIR